MKNDHFLNKRSIKLLILFSFMIVLILVFLSSVGKTIHSDRKLPPHNSVIHDRALRGSILSHDGFTLSRSNKSYQATVYAPSIDPEKRNLFIRLFAIYSGMEEEKIRQAFLDRKGKPRKGYVTLNKTIDASTAIYLKSLSRKLRKMRVFHSVRNHHGVEVLYGLDITENGELREFPLHDTLTPALGYIRAKNVGRYSKIFGIKGLEKRYEKYLSMSQDGLIRGKRDVSGTVILSKSSMRIPRRDGYDLSLTIPLALQKRVEVTLDRMKRATQAKEIIAAVMESGTGHLLALASSERYDPLHITQEDIAKLNNKFTGYPYEPGSVLKPLTLSIALEHGRVTPKTIFPIYGGRLRISKRYTITDDEAFDQLSATGIIIHSSNVGISQISWLLSGKEMHEGLKKFGLGQRTGIDLSRELPGKIKSARLLENKLHRANQSYGYGLEATFVQLLKAYSVFNNEGVMVTPTLADYLRSSDGRKFHLRDRPQPQRVLSGASAHVIKKILEKVVQEGTGVKARYPGLEIGGKTGTAHIAVHGKYVRRFNSSFYGFANDDKGHRYTLGVLVIEAQGYHKYFAAQSAVPTFRGIVENLVELGYLQPNLSEQAREKMLEKEREHRAAVRRKQAERTRRIKALLRQERQKMKQRNRKPHPRQKTPLQRKSRAPTPSPRPTPHEALPDMF